MSYRGSTLLAAAMLLMAAMPAFAQNVDQYKSEFEDRLHQQGDSFTLCYNVNSATTDFDKTLAGEIGAALLTDVKVAPIESLPPHNQYDVTLNFTQDQIYILMAEQCDGIMGFVLAPGYASWLTVTRPYLVADNVMVSNDPSLQKMDDIPKTRPIGARVGTDGDSSLLAYDLALPENSRWQRFTYFDNDLLLKRLTDGTVAAGVIWEPVLNIATGGDPASKGLHPIAAPFNIAKTEVGIGVRANDAYLNTELGDAIKALVADGTIDKLMAQFHLSNANTPAQAQQNPQ